MSASPAANTTGIGGSPIGVAPILPAVPSLKSTFGALLLGTFLGLMLYGLSVHQTYRYFLLYREDLRLLRTMVIVLFVVDTLHTVICMHTCYFYLVENYFNPPALQFGVWSIRLIVPCSSVVIILGQAFYARRVYMLGGRLKYIAALAGILMVGALGFAMAASAESFIQPTFLKWEDWTWLTSGAFAFALATDVTLTTTLILFLRKSRTGFRRTDSMLNVLIVYTINTGLLTSTLSLLCVILAVVQPKNMVYIALGMPTTKSYLNSVLAVLNSRSSLKEASRSDEFGTFGMSGVMGSAPLKVQRMRMPQSVIDIKIARPGGGTSEGSSADVERSHGTGSEAEGENFEMKDRPGAFRGIAAAV